MSEHDAVTPLPGAPGSDDDSTTALAPWHNQPGTGAVAEPPVTTIRAFDRAEDGTLVAKVVEPPARPTRKAGPKAEAKTKGPPAADTAAASAKGKDIPLEGVAFAAVAVDHDAESA